MSDINNLEQLEMSFGESFLEHHTGHIIQDARYAIVELVANCWDAGASKVEILWPEKSGEMFLIHDDGVGMTKEEFSTRWGKLNYNRIISQGKDVQFPHGRGTRHRVAFGKNGIGRHAMFCFCNEYALETVKEGERIKATVAKTNDGNFPFKVTIVESKPDEGTSWTTISGIATKNIELSANTILKTIGSKFVADPEFEISVNGEKVLFEDLGMDIETYDVPIEGIGTVKIKRLEGERSRTTQQQGVAWWVNNRLVGTPTWDNINGRLIDGRNTIAKKYVYIVSADFLKPSVKADWSGFNTSSETVAVKNKVYEFINDDLISLLSETRTLRRDMALYANDEIIASLPLIIQEDISDAIDELQRDCPTFGANELESAVKVLANMEKSRSGYALLEKLAAFKPEDIDSLNVILAEWSISDIKKIVKELHWRLDLINKLEQLVDNPAADEVHDLQPLFERGLWIFGPEFETLSFTSNRSLATVVKKFFGTAVLETPDRRPDFVILPDSSLGIYSRDAYDNDHNIAGLDSVVIVEIKKGDFELTFKEKDQATAYAREIRGSGKVNAETKIVCYVLGSKISASSNGVDKPTTEGSTTVIPRRYSTVLKQAHARTFNLLKQVELALPERATAHNSIAPELFSN